MKLLNKVTNIWIMAAAVLKTGCSSTKSVHERDALYKGASVHIIGDSLSKREKNKLKGVFEEQLTLRPNKKFLRIPIKLYIHNSLGEANKDKGIKHWWKNRVGEKPVLLSQVDIP